MEELMNVLKLLDAIKALKDSGIEDDWIMSGLITFLNKSQVDEAIDFFNSVDIDEIKAECNNSDEASLSKPDNLISLMDFFTEYDN